MENSVALIERYFELSELQKERFARLLELYSEWNAKINVISRRDMDNFYERHVLHSLAIAKSGEIVPGERVLDLGCGGGFPVVPLAILMPDVSFTAVDSIGKKIKVVEAVVKELGLDNVTVHNCRVESLDERWDWVVSRAVAPLGDLLNWTRGKYDRGMLLLKGGDLAAEIADSKISSKKVMVESVSHWFDSDFFVTKSLLKVRS